jgi:hypothetical protein
MGGERAALPGLGDLTTLKGSPAIPTASYAAQSSGWFGQVMQRSTTAAPPGEPVDNKFVYDGTPGTHQWARRHAPPLSSSGCGT